MNFVKPWRTLTSNKRWASDFSINDERMEPPRTVFDWLDASSNEPIKDSSARVHENDDTTASVLSEMCHRFVAFRPPPVLLTSSVHVENSSNDSYNCRGQRSFCPGIQIQLTPRVTIMIKIVLLKPALDDYSRGQNVERISLKTYVYFSLR